ncbi:hypothetical protein PG993_014861 [Apiospora rasikravindrae]|uniref:Uncharacterized protein n=1 Tax=Apiospora rasikravindrae TaxID=990691 RepID=A0ABR1RPB2_9PEZI
MSISAACWSAAKQPTAYSAGGGLRWLGWRRSWAMRKPCRCPASLQGPAALGQKEAQNVLACKA